MQSIWSISRIVFIVIIVIYAGMTIYLYFFQSQMIYYPDLIIDMTPADIGLAFDEVFFVSGDGVRLCGWFIHSEQSKNVVLFCHGNAGNISDRLDTISIFNQLGLSIFIFDYRGYGKSEGKPDEKGTYADAEAAMKWIVENKNILHEDVIIFGRSLGGAVAAWLAKKCTPRALILESAFTSVPDMGSKIYPWLPVRLMSRFSYSTIDYIRDVNSPVLIIHSPDDMLVPFSQGKRLFEAAHEPREFMEIAGDHNNGFLLSGSHYHEGLNAFISKY